jgi:hypothetical protein
LRSEWSRTKTVTRSLLRAFNPRSLRHVWPAAPDNLQNFRNFTSRPRNPRRAHGSRACRQGPLGKPRGAHAIGCRTWHAGDFAYADPPPAPGCVLVATRRPPRRRHARGKTGENRASEESLKPVKPLVRKGGAGRARTDDDQIMSRAIVRSSRRQGRQIPHCLQRVFLSSSSTRIMDRAPCPWGKRGKVDQAAN